MSEFNQAGTTPGGVASGSAPSSNPGGGAAGAGAQAASFGGGNAAPSVVELSEDSLVRLPGAKEPVKYGDYYRNFQSEFTRRAQEAARYRQEAERHQQLLRERESEIQRYRTALTGERGPAQNPTNDLVSKLKSLPYLKGEDAVALTEHITQQIGQRDQLFQQAVAGMALMYRQMQAMQQQLGQFQSRYATSDFDNKITSAMKQVGVPDSAADWAKEIYLAYEEGPELDREFVNILRQRWEQVRNLTREADKRRVEEARSNPFTPTRGGNGSPSRPLSLAGKSAAEKAELLWQSLEGSDT
jgi:hypothetical protein